MMSLMMRRAMVRKEVGESLWRWAIPDYVNFWIAFFLSEVIRKLSIFYMSSMDYIEL
jgi:hypothetical protein